MPPKEADLIASIEATLEWARKAEYDGIRHQMIGGASEPDDDFIDAQERLKHYLEDASIELLLLAERLNVPLGRSDFKISLGKLDLSALEPMSVDMDLYSPALRMASRFFLSLKSIAGAVDSSKLSIFENILHNSAKIIHDAELNPSNETGVRNAVLKAMGYAFVDVRKEVQMPQAIKNYRGDIGVASLGAIAEYKFADSKEAAKNCLDGIYSDMKAYPSGGDWRHFYAVLYLTAPFYTQRDVEQAFADIRAEDSWKPVVLVGAGERKSGHKR